MFYFFALILIAATSQPVDLLKGKTGYETMEACEQARKSDVVQADNAKIIEAFTARGKAQDIEFAFKFECREEKKKDDGSI